MNNSSFAAIPESDKPTLYKPLLANVDRLRGKLKGFSVLGHDESLVGEVENLVLDANQTLSLVVAQPSQAGSRFVLLNTRLIQKVSNQTRTVSVDLIQTDVSYLPDYVPPEVSHAIPDSENAAVQYPADPAEAIGAVENFNYPLDEAADQNQSIALQELLDYPSSPKVLTGEIAASETDLMVESAPPAEMTATAVTIQADITIPLLEERLKTDYKRRKIGEVIVRKQIETRIIEVPVRYEKLLIEQVSPEQVQLAEIDLSQGSQDVSTVELVGQRSPIVSGEFTSPRVASQILDAIAKTLHHRCKKVRIEIELDDISLSETYQAWMNQYNQP